MQAIDGGWHELVSEQAAPAPATASCCPMACACRIPASRFQPQDVHGPSEVVDPRAYAWRDAGWQGRAWEEAVVYELHVGAFTPAGDVPRPSSTSSTISSRSASPRSRSCRSPTFPAGRNWGYDGVLPYAPDSAYGRPEDFKALVDAAHARGLMVLLDVVYNHFGPGRRLPARDRAGDLHRPAQDAVGRGHQHRRRRRGGRCATTSSTTRSTGSRSSISTACAWTRCMRSSTTARGTCWWSWPSACAQPRPDRQIHLVLENEENQASRLVRERRGQAALVHGAVERRRAPRAARGGDAARRTATTATTTATPPELGPRACRRLRLPGRGHAVSRPRARRAERGAAADRLRRLHAEPRPGRQPRLRRTSDGHRAAARRCAPWLPSTCCCRRFRCCSWARNGPRRSRFRSSAISAPNWPTPCARGGARSSRAFRSSRIRRSASGFPIRWPRRRSLAPSSTGMTWCESRMPAGSTGTAACSPFGMPTSCRGLVRLRRSGQYQVIGDGAVMVRWPLDDAARCTGAGGKSARTFHRRLCTCPGTGALVRGPDGSAADRNQGGRRRRGVRPLGRALDAGRRSG